MKISKLMILIVFVLAIGVVSASQQTLMGFQSWIYNNDGTPFTSGTIVVNVSDSNDCNGDVNSTTYVDQTTDEGILDVMLSMNMSYNNNYWLCLLVEGEQVIGPSNFRGLGEIGIEDVSFSITGSNPFDQVLNTTSNVTFYNITSTGDAWCNSTNCYTAADFLLDTTGGNPFDQSLNTTEEVTFLNLILSGNMTLGEFILSDLLPNPTLTLDLGSGANRWDWIYVRNISADYGNFLYDVDIDGGLNVENINATSMNVTNMTIKNMWVINTIASGNVTADYFFGNGSQLTDLPAGNPFDQSLNTTDDVTFNSTTVVNNLTVGTTTQGILIKDGDMYFDGGTIPWDDVKISESSNTLSLYARANVDKNKWVQMIMSPTTGYTLSFGVNAVKEFYSDTADAILGRDSSPWGIIYAKNLSDGTTTVNMSTVLKYSYNMSDGAGNMSWNESYADTLYAPVNYGDDWNKTYADTLYAAIGSANNPFDQSLNTTEQVQFARTTVDNITIRQYLVPASGSTTLLAPISFSNQIFTLPLGHGTSGQALITDGAGTWSWSSFMSEASHLDTNTYATAVNYTIPSTGKQVILCKPGSVNINVTLPVFGSGQDGKRYDIKKTTNTGTCTIFPVGADDIDGQSSFKLSTQYESVTLVGKSFTGGTDAEWNVIGYYNGTY